MFDELLEGNLPAPNTILLSFPPRLPRPLQYIWLYSAFLTA